jgi:hypothetical protein
MTIDPTLKPTDLLTSLSVLCAVCTLIYAWRKDRRLRSREYADRIRAAAAITLSKADRCQTLLHSIVDLVQPAITEADGLFTKTKDPIECRDQFWKRLHEIRSAILEKFTKEEIEIAYAPLLPYRSNIYDLFQTAIREARAVEEASLHILQSRCQHAILAANPEHAHSAMLGNDLRDICDEHNIQLGRHLSDALASIRGCLREIIEADEHEILKSDTSVQGRAPPDRRRSDPSYWITAWDTFGPRVRDLPEDWSWCVPSPRLERLRELRNS